MNIRLKYICILLFVFVCCNVKTYEEGKEMEFNSKKYAAIKIAIESQISTFSDSVVKGYGMQKKHETLVRTRGKNLMIYLQISKAIVCTMHIKI